MDRGLAVLVSAGAAHGAVALHDAARQCQLLPEALTLRARDAPLHELREGLQALDVLALDPHQAALGEANAGLLLVQQLLKLIPGLRLAALEALDVGHGIRELLGVAADVFLVGLGIWVGLALGLDEVRVVAQVLRLDVVDGLLQAHDAQPRPQLLHEELTHRELLLLCAIGHDLDLLGGQPAGHDVDLARGVGGGLAVLHRDQRQPEILEGLVWVRQELPLRHGQLDAADVLGVAQEGLPDLEVDDEVWVLLGVDGAAPEEETAVPLEGVDGGPIRRVSVADHGRLLHSLAPVRDDLSAVVQHAEIHKATDGRAGRRRRAHGGAGKSLRLLLIGEDLVGLEKVLIDGLVRSDGMGRGAQCGRIHDGLQTQRSGVRMQDLLQEGLPRVEAPRLQQQDVQLAACDGLLQVVVLLLQLGRIGHAAPVLGHLGRRLVVVHALAAAEHGRKLVHLRLAGGAHADAPFVLAGGLARVRRQRPRGNDEILVHVGGHVLDAVLGVEVVQRLRSLEHVLRALVRGVVDVDARVVHCTDQGRGHPLEHAPRQRALLGLRGHRPLRGRHRRLRRGGDGAVRVPLQVAGDPVRLGRLLAPLVHKVVRQLYVARAVRVHAQNRDWDLFVQLLQALAHGLRAGAHKAAGGLPRVALGPKDVADLGVALGDEVPHDLRVEAGQAAVDELFLGERHDELVRDDILAKGGDEALLEWLLGHKVPETRLGILAAEDGIAQDAAVILPAVRVPLAVLFQVRFLVREMVAEAPAVVLLRGRVHERLGHRQHCLVADAERALLLALAEHALDEIPVAKREIDADEGLVVARAGAGIVHHGHVGVHIGVEGLGLVHAHVDADGLHAVGHDVVEGELSEKAFFDPLRGEGLGLLLLVRVVVLEEVLPINRVRVQAWDPDRALAGVDAFSACGLLRGDLHHLDDHLGQHLGDVVQLRRLSLLLRQLKCRLHLRRVLPRPAAGWQRQEQARAGEANRIVVAVGRANDVVPPLVGVILVAPVRLVEEGLGAVQRGALHGDAADGGTDPVGLPGLARGVLEVPREAQRAQAQLEEVGDVVDAELADAEVGVEPGLAVRGEDRGHDPATDELWRHDLAVLALVHAHGPDRALRVGGVQLQRHIAVEDRVVSAKGRGAEFDRDLIGRRLVFRLLQRRHELRQGRRAHEREARHRLRRRQRRGLGALGDRHLDLLDLVQLDRGHGALRRHELVGGHGHGDDEGDALGEVRVFVVVLLEGRRLEAETHHVDAREDLHVAAERREA
mmetsp:Transcript_53478/g.174033  ORF Transcript_53478/g.174033 Transcript_53478/m.174033 type:complete len:1255 (+) Transcript_53478:5394-9158(+)